MGSGWKSDDEECSVIGDKGEIGFIDYEDDKSVCSYNPIEEGPVVISAPFLFVGGKPQSVLVGQTSTDSITINNTTSEPIDLWTVKIFCSNPEDSYTLSLMKPPSDNSTTEDVESFLETFTLEDRVLQPRKTLTVWLSCKPKDIGLHTTVVHFDAGDDRIERVVFLLAEDKISQSLASNKPYQRTQRKKRFAVTDYVAGSRPARPGNQSYKYKLPQYTIPGDIRESLENKQVPEVVSEGLNRENYGAFFSTLLIMEELKLEEDMKGHDMECITMRRRGQFLALEVPGLAERRPSLVIGDFVFAKPATGDPDDGIPPYQGFIHRVEADEVFLKFNRDVHFLHTDGDLYTIRFTYNRVNMRRLYQAVQNAGKLDDELLFPSQSPRREIQAAPAVPLTRCLNMEQMTSVEMILGCKGAPPYVIHGPPGTGKTLTLVEAILQLYKTRKNSRILVCASSNSAADHVLENLISKDYVKIQESEVFRLNASSRPYEDVRTERIQFCYFEEYVFRCPPIKALMRYRIIISTYMSASLLYSEGIKQGHFSHIFLDEAGQASEPETMVPISNLCRRETVVVLAGDPMQLGPVIYSKDAETYGLGKSYLERLFECEFYRNEDENFVTKLVRNYRCHPAILELPSKLFYKGELIADKEEAKSPLGSWANLLPNKDFPVLFIGIQGCDEREGNNPSWFNRIEASKVVEIIRKLRTSAELNDSDIGVITPYRQQVQKLRKTLDDQMDMPDVKVGSVEQFQGQERQVIIISTVRSTVKHNEFDRVHYLGFLSNPRRFNVAITRARSLLVIIGNPHIITKDPYWDKLLRYCADNNSYQGCPLPERQEFTEEDFNVSQKLYYEQDNFQSSNQGEWSSEQENFQPSNEAGWGDNHGEWGDGQQNYQPSNEAGWGDNQGEWGGGQQNFQSSNKAGWVDSQGDGQQNFQPSNEAGWGDSQGEWGDGQQNIKPSNESGWGDSQGEWGDGQQNIKPSNESGWGDSQGEWGDGGDGQQNIKPSNESGWGDNQGEWGDEQQNFKPSNETGWDDKQGEWDDRQQNFKPSNEAGWDDKQGEWDDRQQNFKPSNEAGWDDKQGEWDDRQQNFKPSNEAGWDDKQGEWDDRQQNFKPSNEAGWDDKQGEWDDRQQNFKPSNEAGWDDKQGEWDDRQQNFKPSDEAGWDDKQGEWDDRQRNFKPSNEARWDDESSNAAEKAKPVNDDAGWSDGRKSTEIPNPVAKKAGWPDGRRSGQSPKPIAEKAGRSDGWRSRQSPKPVKYEAKSSNGWRVRQSPKPVKYEAKSSNGWRSAELPKPITDDSEGSDGWKSAEVPSSVTKEAESSDGRNSLQCPKPVTHKLNSSGGSKSSKFSKPVIK